MNAISEFDAEFASGSCPCGCRGNRELHEAFESGLTGAVSRQRRFPRRPPPRAGAARPAVGRGTEAALIAAGAGLSPLTAPVTRSQRMPEALRGGRPAPGVSPSRRVEVFFRGMGRVVPACPVPPTLNRDFIVWLQRSLNQVLGLRLLTDGVVGV